MASLLFGHCVMYKCNNFHLYPNIFKNYYMSAKGFYVYPGGYVSCFIPFCKIKTKIEKR